ncbi:MAG: hypothetical protein HZA77_03030 [Candidatus Schekmanbacteria bacterium]|nr:hypothetical protein [Candidatus Schekmanbacteria bacterium]
MKSATKCFFGLSLLTPAIISSCTQNDLNDTPFAIILLPAIGAIAVVGILLYLLMIRQRETFYSAQKTMTKNLLVSEIERAKRHGHRTGIMIMDIEDSVGRGIHYFLPGRTVNVEHVEKEIRKSDQFLQVDYRRYKVVLSHITADNSANIIKDRLLKIAEEKKWPDIKIGVATYPTDGESAESLINSAIADMERS